MRILISGSSGLIGSELVPYWSALGYEVARLVRGTTPAGAGDRRWRPEDGGINPKDLEGFDAVVHLAGENVAAGRWTAAKKGRIRASRVEGTALLARALADINRPPAVLLCASATGYYGDRADEPLDEDSGPGDSFLSSVCRAWEEAAAPAARAGIRVASIRTGIALTRYGGALKAMLPPFRLGLGGRIGSGRQFMSWIAMEDLVRVYDFVLTGRLSGPVNAVSPEPATNRAFAETLAGVLGRPSVIPFPAAAARLALGSMADELLLASAKAYPKRLEEAGFSFRYPLLEGALRQALNPDAASTAG